MSEITITVPIKHVVLFENPSKRSEDDVLELAKDIGLHGMIHYPTARVKLVTMSEWKLSNYDEASLLGDLNDGYIQIEIGPGQTRFMAAQKLSWTEITVKLVEMNDDQFRALMVSENVKRHDMHSLDLSDYYQRCVDKKESVRKIATRHGVTEASVKKLLKLQQLCETGKELFRAGGITIEHAVNLTAGTIEWQEAFMKENIIETPIGKILNDTPHSIIDNLHDSYSQLRYFDWDLSDSTLVPEAGSCKGCLKRTGAGNNLFSDWLGEQDSQNDRCLDKPCAIIKAEAHFQRKLEQYRLMFPNIKEVQYIHTDYGNTDASKYPGVTFIKHGRGRIYEHMPRPCEAEVLIGRAHPIFSPYSIGDVAMYCMDPTCKVHNMTSSGSSEKRDTIGRATGAIVAEPMESEVARTKLEKAEAAIDIEASAKAKSSALAAVINGAAREDVIDIAGFSEPTWWRLFETICKQNEQGADMVLRQVAKAQEFDTFKCNTYGWYSSLAKEISSNEIKTVKWREWLIKNQAWFIRCTIAAQASFGTQAGFKEYLSEVAGVDLDAHLEPAKRELGKKLEAKRNEVSMLAAADTIRIEAIDQVLRSESTQLYQDEEMELLGKVVHGQIKSLTLPDLKVLAKYFGATVKRDHQVEDVEKVILDIVEVWRKRIERHKQLKELETAKAAGHVDNCPNCKKWLSVPEIISNTCDTCGWPEVKEDWKDGVAPEDKAEAAKVIADGGVSTCHQCGKELTTEEIIDQWCDSCEDNAALDEKLDDEEE